MAKKGARQFIGLVCSVCGHQNYTSQKNKTNSPEKVTIKKYCSSCHKTTDHKETSKLK
ncbi:50S ribosomal protein L33 [Candidatus Shapirobacteria bacterium]|nr:50S ribosomal protein L33 [Candidatus Shapirobacteria bacterium]